MTNKWDSAHPAQAVDINRQFNKTKKKRIKQDIDGEWKRNRWVDMLTHINPCFCVPQLLCQWVYTRAINHSMNKIPIFLRAVSAVIFGLLLNRPSWWERGKRDWIISDTFFFLVEWRLLIEHLLPFFFFKNKINKIEVLTFFSNGNGWDSVENWRYHLKTKQTQFISAAALAFQAFSFFLVECQPAASASLYAHPFKTQNSIL